MLLDPTSIFGNCTEINIQYQKSIEAYDFFKRLPQRPQRKLQKLFINIQQQIYQQSIGKLRIWGDDFEQEVTVALEQLTENESQQFDPPKSSETNIKQELENAISQKLQEQSHLIEQIQFGERSYNKLNADREDIQDAITELTEKLEINRKQLNEALEANSTRGKDLSEFQTQLQFFKNQKKMATSFVSVKQWSELSILTQDKINQIFNGIQEANQIQINVQEENSQANNELKAKNAEMQEIEQEMEQFNQALQEIKQKSEQMAIFIEEQKQKYKEFLNSQKQGTLFLEINQQLNSFNKQGIRKS